MSITSHSNLAFAVSNVLILNFDYLNKRAVCHFCTRTFFVMQTFVDIVEDITHVRDQSIEMRNAFMNKMSCINLNRAIAGHFVSC